MNQVITVFEHNHINISQYRNLATSTISYNDVDLLNLINFEDKNGKIVKIFEFISRHKIQFKSYVGSIQLSNGLTIEILPKFASELKYSENDIKTARKTLISMIKVSHSNSFIKSKHKNIKSPSTSIPLAEAFLEYFILELSNELRKGLIKKYVKKRISTNSLSGKLVVHENIKVNAFDATSFIVDKELYCEDNHLMQIFKASIKMIIQLHNLSRNTKNKMKETLQLLENITDIILTANDFKKIDFDRTNSRFEDLFHQCKFILKKTFPFLTNTSNNSKFWTMLFNMDFLFEDFLLYMFKRNKINVIPQNTLPGFKHNQSYVYGKPDFTYLYENKIHVFDAKWKMFKSKGFNKSVPFYGLDIPNFWQLVSYASMAGKDASSYFIVPKSKYLKVSEDSTLWFSSCNNYVKDIGVFFIDFSLGFENIINDYSIVFDSSIERFVLKYRKTLNVIEIINNFFELLKKVKYENEENIFEINIIQTTLNYETEEQFLLFKKKIMNINDNDFNSIKEKIYLENSNKRIYDNKEVSYEQLKIYIENFEYKDLSIKVKEILSINQKEDLDAENVVDDSIIVKNSEMQLMNDLRAKKIFSPKVFCNLVDKYNMIERDKFKKWMIEHKQDSLDPIIISKFFDNIYEDTSINRKFIRLVYSKIYISKNFELFLKAISNNSILEILGILPFIEYFDYISKDIIRNEINEKINIDYEIIRTSIKLIFNKINSLPNEEIIIIFEKFIKLNLPHELKREYLNLFSTLTNNIIDLNLYVNSIKFNDSLDIENLLNANLSDASNIVLFGNLKSDEIDMFLNAISENTISKTSLSFLIELYKYREQYLELIDIDIKDDCIEKSKYLNMEIITAYLELAKSNLLTELSLEILTLILNYLIEQETINNLINELISCKIPNEYYNQYVKMATSIIFSKNAKKIEKFSDIVLKPILLSENFKNDKRIIKNIASNFRKNYDVMEILYENYFDNELIMKLLAKDFKVNNVEFKYKEELQKYIEPRQYSSTNLMNTIEIQ